MPILYMVAAAALASMLLIFLNHRLASPMLAIIDRWLRWIVFALAGAVICKQMQWVDRPYPVLIVSGLILWFLGETLYNWLAIASLSLSPFPLFPRYISNPSGEGWPVQPRLLAIRDWLRDQGFRSVQALKAEVGGGIYLRVSIYQDPAAYYRIQVTFLPQANGTLTACYSITSITEPGIRIVTDNLYIPFGGFYPESWYVQRLPWTRSLQKLLRRHEERMKRMNLIPTPFVLEPLPDLNNAQHQLDQVNTELGFLHAHADREDFGKITHEGRYRVWKEIWMLNYLGRAARYD